MNEVVMNKELARQILEILESCKTVIKEAKGFWKNHNISSTERVLNSLAETINGVKLFLEKSCNFTHEVILRDACKACLVYIKNIEKYICNNKKEADENFEKLVTLFDAMYSQYKAWINNEAGDITKDSKFQEMIKIAINEEKEQVYKIIRKLEDNKSILKDIIVSWDNNQIDEMLNKLDYLTEKTVYIKQYAEEEHAFSTTIRLKDACECCLVCIQNVKKSINEEAIDTDWKLKKELVAFFDTIYFQYMYWACVKEYQEPQDKKKLLDEVSKAAMFNDIDKSEKIKLSIIVIAYNHLDYTKRAVESVLREMPMDINVELILYNHGSSDGTMDYFKSIKSKSVVHIVDIAINSAVPIPPSAITKGEYVICVSNDVEVGKNSIKNMVRAMDEEENVGWIVPTTSKVFNLQDINLSYKDYNEFLIESEKNNVYNPLRHEQRVRLCNPIDIIRSDLFERMHKEFYIDLYCSGNLQSFPDDKLSLWMRRNGYRMLLQKDAYCHHGGSITLSEELADIEKEFYTQGIADFINAYGIDPWGKGACFNNAFCDVNMPKYEGEKEILILGVNSGIGATPLKIRENLKEQGATNLRLINITHEKKYLRDLNGVSDGVYEVKTISEYIKQANVKKIDCVVVEEYEKSLEEVISEIANSGATYHHLFYKTRENEWNYVIQ